MGTQNVCLRHRFVANLSSYQKAAVQTKTVVVKETKAAGAVVARLVEAGGDAVVAESKAVVAVAVV